MKQLSKLAGNLQKRIGYNKEHNRFFIDIEYLKDKDKDELTSFLSDFIYKWSDEIGTDNAYQFTAEGLEIIEELAEYQDSLDEITDQIMEQADSRTPIYYHEIGEWLKDNVSLVDEVKAELGSESGDTYKDTQTAYCLTLERVTNDLLQELAEMVECPECGEYEMADKVKDIDGHNLVDIRQCQSCNYEESI